MMILIFVRYAVGKTMSYKLTTRIMMEELMK